MFTAPIHRMLALVAALVGSQALGLAQTPNETAAVEVTITNPIAQQRPSETIELDWARLVQAQPAIAAAAVRVVDAESGREVVAQPLDVDGNNKTDKLIFQVDLAPNAVRRFKVEAAAPTAGLTEASPVHAQFLPRRLDDMAWENDKAAWRTYGPAVAKAEGLISSGIDVWVKRVSHPIINRWFFYGIDYHRDSGEGADFFSVGPTLGGGGSAIWDGEGFKPSPNFNDWIILANGPVRAMFELGYPAIELADGNRVTERRRYSIDAGHQLTRMAVTYTFERAPERPMFVAGLVERDGVQTQAGPGDRWISMWGPIGREGDGQLGTGIVMEQAGAESLSQDKHFLLRAPIEPGQPTAYWSGGGWTRAGEIMDAAQWQAYLENWAERLAHPVQVDF